MKTRYVLITLGCLLAVALAVVHLRTRRVTLGYRMHAARRQVAQQEETIRTQKLRMATASSAAALERRKARTPIDLVGPEQAADFIPPDGPARQSPGAEQGEDVNEGNP